MYDLMQKSLKINEYIKDLDGEIEELHRYVSLMEERESNRNVEWLNKVATVLLPATLIAGVFGMNYGDNIVIKSFWGQFIIVTGVIVIAVIYFVINSLIKKKKS
jgi:Mg2+ and Co2+ transporter CorA